ncbi:MAG: energy transducer TonB [Betaproteobacteria bacterium]|nr:energy transducer TonB [Betaproteobacteria bacterium]
MLAEHSFDPHAAPYATVRLPTYAPRFKPSLLALIGVMHAGAIAGLLAFTPARAAMHETLALMVSIVEPKPPARPEVLPQTKLPPMREIAPVIPPLPVIEYAPANSPMVLSVAEAPQPVSAAEQPVSNAPAGQVAPPRFDADYLENPAPVYPKLSKRMHETGSVTLAVYVEPSGLPSRVELQASSRHERLDQAAIDAVKRWRFVPARRGEAAVAAWVLVPIHFSLKA